MADDTDSKKLTDERELASTNAGPAFLDQAEDLARRLEAVHDRPDVRQLGVEARELAERFRRWATERPATSVRVASIQSLLELHRRANELLTHAPHGALPDPPPDGILARLLRRRSH